MAGFKQGLFWGAVFGGIAGLMNAPQKGSETRAELKAYVKQTQEDVTDLKSKVNHLQSLVEILKTDGLKNTLEFTKDIQSQIREFTENNQPRFKRIQQRIEQLQKDIASK